MRYASQPGPATRRRLGDVARGEFARVVSDQESPSDGNSSLLQRGPADNRFNLRRNTLSHHCSASLDSDNAANRGSPGDMNLLTPSLTASCTASGGIGRTNCIPISSTNPATGLYRSIDRRSGKPTRTPRNRRLSPERADPTPAPAGLRASTPGSRTGLQSVRPSVQPRDPDADAAAPHRSRVSGVGNRAGRRGLGPWSRSPREPLAAFEASYTNPDLHSSPCPTSVAPPTGSGSA